MQLIALFFLKRIIFLILMQGYSNSMKIYSTYINDIHRLPWQNELGETMKSFMYVYYVTSAIYNLF